MQSVFVSAILILFYFCAAIIVFAPSIYMGWIYIISRKTPGTKKGMLRPTLITIAVNLLLAYFLVHLALDQFVYKEIAKNDAIARNVLSDTIEAQKRFFSNHGRYYSVGPVRGPYKDEHGLEVSKDVIVRVVPKWDETGQKHTFEAYAIHVLGREILVGTPERGVKKTRGDAEKAEAVRAKLLRSVN